MYLSESDVSDFFFYLWMRSRCRCCTGAIHAYSFYIGIFPPNLPKRCRPRDWCTKENWRNGQSKAKLIGNQGFSLFYNHISVCFLNCMPPQLTMLMWIYQVLQAVRSRRRPTHPSVFSQNWRPQTQRCDLGVFGCLFCLELSSPFACVFFFVSQAS